jgi:hypothetical protein
VWREAAGHVEGVSFLCCNINRTPKAFLSHPIAFLALNGDAPALFDPTA